MGEGGCLARYLMSAKGKAEPATGLDVLQINQLQIVNVVKHPTLSTTDGQCFPIYYLQQSYRHLQMSMKETYGVARNKFLKNMTNGKFIVASNMNV